MKTRRPGNTPRRREGILLQVRQRSHRHLRPLIVWAAPRRPDDHLGWRFNRVKDITWPSLRAMHR